MNRIVELIKKHEGFRTYPYRDSVGKLTIGYGRNLEDRGINKDEATYLLESDVSDFTQQLKDRLYWFDSIHENAQLVLIDMAFNMGLNGLLSFHQTLEHIKNENYKAASITMLQSKWEKQVGNRAIELSEILKLI